MSSQKRFEGGKITDNAGGREPIVMGSSLGRRNQTRRLRRWHWSRLPDIARREEGKGLLGKAKEVGNPDREGSISKKKRPSI